MITISKPIIGEEEKKAVMDVLNSGMIAQGPRVKELEEKFAQFCGTKYAIAVNSGTAALHCALYALGIKEGDEVITTPFTFVATANPILMQKAKIVFADINKEDFNIDPEEIEKKITSKTKAIIVVDLYGNPFNVNAIKKIAEKYNLKIIEDACQAHGAQYKELRAGNFGDIGCFSFYATKNMMCGEGGMITTNDENYAELCKRFRHHGQSEQTRYEYYDIGYNYRMMDLQAAIALEQLKKIDNFTYKRIANAELFNSELSGIKGVIIPKTDPDKKHVFHQYTVICDNQTIQRDELAQYLKENGVGVGIYYPKPLHLHPHFLKMGYKKGDFPISEEISSKVLSLPIHPEVHEEEIKKITNLIKEFYKKNE